MASQDSRLEGVKRIVDILRSATLTVQILPFVLSSLFIFDFWAYTKLSDTALSIIDSALYVSPLVVIAMLVLSKVLRLCRWHRIACLIPTAPDIMNIVDFFFPLSKVEAYAFNITIVTMVVLLLIAAYNVFLK